MVNQNGGSGELFFLENALQRLEITLSYLIFLMMTDKKAFKADKKTILNLGKIRHSIFNCSNQEWQECNEIYEDFITNFFGNELSLPNVAFLNIHKYIKTWLDKSKKVYNLTYELALSLASNGFGTIKLGDIVLPQSTFGITFERAIQVNLSGSDVLNIKSCLVNKKMLGDGSQEIEFLFFTQEYVEEKIAPIPNDKNRHRLIKYYQDFLELKTEKDGKFYYSIGIDSEAKNVQIKDYLNYAIDKEGKYSYFTRLSETVVPAIFLFCVYLQNLPPNTYIKVTEGGYGGVGENNKPKIKSGSGFGAQKVPEQSLSPEILEIEVRISIRAGKEILVAQTITHSTGQNTGREMPPHTRREHTRRLASGEVVPVREAKIRPDKGEPKITEVKV